MENNLAGIGVSDYKKEIGQSDSKNEVFTPDSIVREMLDETDNLLKINGIQTDEDYLQYIILEPTCGTGNFLVRELERKLRIVNKYTGIEKEIALLRAVSSIHGIELTASNVVVTKLRLLELIKTGKTSIFELEYLNKEEINIEPIQLTQDIEKSVQYILNRNIICGNSLTCKKLLINTKFNDDTIWRLDYHRVNDAMFSTSDIELDLMLTQYDFDGTKVAIRERSYANMHSTNEIYVNTSDYVDYNKIYLLDNTEIYKTDDDCEFDF